MFIFIGRQFPQQILCDTDAVTELRRDSKNNTAERPNGDTAVFSKPTVHLEGL